MADRMTRGSVSGGAKAAAGLGGVVRRGFSLMEVMIVIVIILLISGLVAVNLFGAKEDATKKTAQLQLQNLKDGLKFFYLEYNRYPTVEEGVSVLWNKETLDADADEAKWRMFFDEATPTDPWGTEWGYSDESEEGHPFDLWSYGPDREDGTEDDINVWSDSGEEGEGDAGLPPPPPPSGG